MNRKVLNKTMKTNRRWPFPLTTEQKVGSAVHAQSLLSAAVAYFGCSAI